jgi:hypothetical protein
MAQRLEFDEVEFKMALVLVAEMSGLGHSGLTQYHLRHERPSLDALGLLRGQRKMQRQGRLASPTSVFRYKQVSQFVGALQLLPDAMLSYLRACEMHLFKIMRDLSVLPACSGM